MKLTSATRNRLVSAIRDDDTLDDADRDDLLAAIVRTPNGTDLDVEVADGTDGTTDAERTALAVDFYLG